MSERVDPNASDEAVEDIDDIDIEALQREEEENRRSVEAFVTNTALVMVNTMKGAVFPGTFKQFIEQIKSQMVQTVLSSVEGNEINVGEAIQSIERSSAFRSYLARPGEIGKIYKREFVLYGYQFLKYLARALTVYNKTQKYPVAIDGTINELKKAACERYGLGIKVANSLMEIGTDEHSEEKLKRLISIFDNERGKNNDSDIDSLPKSPPLIANPASQPSPQAESTPPAVATSITTVEPQPSATETVTTPVTPTPRKSPIFTRKRVIRGAAVAVLGIAALAIFRDDNNSASSAQPPTDAIPVTSASVGEKANEIVKPADTEKASENHQEDSEVTKDTDVKKGEFSQTIPTAQPSSKPQLQGKFSSPTATSKSSQKSDRIKDDSANTPPPAKTSDRVEDTAPTKVPSPAKKTERFF